MQTLSNAANDITLRVAQLAAALGCHDRGYFKPEEIAADAMTLIAAADENRRMRADGLKPYDATQTIIKLANKHCTHARFNRKRMIEGLLIKDVFIVIP